VKCVLCGRKVNFHFGDFQTSEEEVEIICDTCLRKRAEGLNNEEKRIRVFYGKLYKKPYTIWVYCEDADWRKLRLCLVHAKTENAWEWRDINHPNKAICTKLAESWQEEVNRK